MSDIPTLRPDNDSSNNNIRIETPDMIESEFGIPYPVIKHMRPYIDAFCDFPQTLEVYLLRMGNTTLFVRKAVMAYNLIKDSGDWTTKDLEVITEVVHMMMYVYQAGRNEIESGMFKQSDYLDDEVSSGRMTEYTYKNILDFIMRLKCLYRELERFDWNGKATGRWAIMNAKKVLILRF